MASPNAIWRLRLIVTIVLNKPIFTLIKFPPRHKASRRRSQQAAAPSIRLRTNSRDSKEVIRIEVLCTRAHQRCRRTSIQMNECKTAFAGDHRVFPVKKKDFVVGEHAFVLCVGKGSGGGEGKYNEAEFADLEIL